MIFASPPLSKWSFAAFGDWGDRTPVFSSILLALKTLDVDAIFLLGDNFYPDGISKRDDERWNVLQYFPKHIQRFAILGNHDYLGDPWAQIQSSHWTMPWFFHERIIPISGETIHVICIDTPLLAPDFTLHLSKSCGASTMRLEQFSEMVFNLGNLQKHWLQQVLYRSKSKWKIVYGHYPIASNGPHKISSSLRSFLLPLFQQYHVSVYVAGHDHNAQIIEESGIYHVISGAASHYVPVPEISFGTTKFVSAQPGFFCFDVTPESICIRFYSVSGTEDICMYLS